MFLSCDAHNEAEILLQCLVFACVINTCVMFRCFICMCGVIRVQVLLQMLLMDTFDMDLLETASSAFFALICSHQVCSVSEFIICV